MLERARTAAARCVDATRVCARRRRRFHARVDAERLTDASHAADARRLARRGFDGVPEPRARSARDEGVGATQDGVDDDVASSRRREGSGGGGTEGGARDGSARRLTYASPPTGGEARAVARAPRSPGGERGDRGVERSREERGATTSEPETAEARARAELERRHREETAKMREALDEAARKVKASAIDVLELQERVRALKEENVGEARVLTRMETQLRRREQEFEAQRQIMAAQLEAAIYSANERDNEALARYQEAREEINAAKLAAAEYVLNDVQRREFALKAGWCARYYNLTIALDLGPIDEYVIEAATYWTDAFGIERIEGESHESIVKRIDAIFIEAAKKPVASYKVDASLIASSPLEDIDEPQLEESQNETPPGPTQSSLPPILNPSWPKNFRQAVGVEIAMRQLVAARTEERVVIALADARREQALVRLSQHGSGTDESNGALSTEEMNEFHFRRAWLRLMWARAREAGLDLGISDEREEHWMSMMNTMADPEMRDPLRFKRDAVAIDKGLRELRTMSIECRLWR